MSTSPWGVLSDHLSRRINEYHDRAQAAKDQQRKDQHDLLMAGLAESAKAGTLTPDMINNTMETMKKGAPKEVHPLLDAFGGVMHSIRRVRDAHKQEQAGLDPNAPIPTVDPGMSMSGASGASSSGLPQPGTSGGGSSPAPSPSATPPPSPVAGESLGLPTPSGTDDFGATAASLFPSPEQRATGEARAKVAGQKVEDEYGNSKIAAFLQDVDKLNLPQNVKDEWKMAAKADQAGVKAPAGLYSASALHPVIVEDPSHPGQRIPAMQDKFTREVTGPDGQVITNPRVVSAAESKPKTGWAKDNKGNFYSFQIGPDNHPVPGTEDYSALPPASYMDMTRTGYYYFTDDSGGVHQIPYTATRTHNIPRGAASDGAAPGGAAAANTSAVPSGMQPPKKKSGQAPAATSPTTGQPVTPGTTVKGEKILGTKDTGVLAPAAQKVLMSTAPVVQQVDRLLGDIDKNSLGDNNTPGYLLGPSIAYKLGYQSDKVLSEDIAGLSLGSVVEAASALQGSSRAIQALRIAMQHTPDAKLDSPKLIKTKLTEIRSRLQSIMDDAKIYGRKRTTVNEQGQVNVPPGMKAPSGEAGGGNGSGGSPDEQAAAWLAKKGYKAKAGAK